MKKLAVVLVLVCGAWGFACSSSGGDGLGNEVIDSEGKEDALARPNIGTYWLEGEAQSGVLTFILLKSDKTFVAAKKTRCVDPAVDKPCVSMLAGAYQFTKSGAKRYIKLLDPAEDVAELALMARYEYKVAQAGTLSLRSAAGKNTPWFELKSTGDTDNAYCDVAADCTLQGLSQPKCPGEWQCTEGGSALYPIFACSYKCMNEGPPCEELKDSQCGPFETDDPDQACPNGMQPIFASCPGGEVCCVPLEGPPCEELANSACISRDAGGTPCPVGSKEVNASCPDIELVCCVREQEAKPCEMIGTCVDDVASQCQYGFVADQTKYSCEPTKVCCADLAGQPVCKEGGWYDSKTNAQICAANCQGKTLECLTKGWYTDADSGCSGDSVIYAVPPYCGSIGTKSEGWYAGYPRALLCYKNCAGLEASATNDGWYSLDGVGCKDDGLIQASKCESPSEEGKMCNIESPNCAAGFLCYPKRIGDATFPMCMYQCGGFMGKACPRTDLACVDYPMDSCDPANGGADCAGACVSK